MRSVILSFALAGLLASNAVPAQQTNDQTQQAMARAQALLRQLAQEKATVDAELSKLRAENAKLKKDATRVQGELADSSSALATAAREAAGVRANLGRSEQRLERTEARLREVIAKYREKAASLRDTGTERDELKAQLATVSRQLADAERKNLALYQINKKILAEFEQEGPWDGLLRKEPFTGLKRVEIENLVQDYEDEIDAQQRDTTRAAITAPATP